MLSLELDVGAVTAVTQGSRVRPYRVRAGVPAFGKDDWARVEERLAEDAWFVAQPPRERDAGHPAPSNPLLPQLPPIAVTVRGRPVVELLHGVYGQPPLSGS